MTAVALLAIPIHVEVLGRKICAVLVLYGRLGPATLPRSTAGSTGGRTRVGSGPRPGPSRPSSATRMPAAPPAPRGGGDGPAASCLIFEGPAPRGRWSRLALPPSTSPRWSGHPRHHRHGRGRRLQPAAPDPAKHRSDRRAQGRTRPRRRSPRTTRTSTWSPRRALGRRQHSRHHRRVPRHRGRHRQLPHPVPGQRRQLC